MALICRIRRHGNVGRPPKGSDFGVHSTATLKNDNIIKQIDHVIAQPWRHGKKVEFKFYLMATLESATRLNDYISIVGTKPRWRSISDVHSTATLESDAIVKQIDYISMTWQRSTPIKVEFKCPFNGNARKCHLIKSITFRLLLRKRMATLDDPRKGRNQMSI